MRYLAIDLGGKRTGVAVGDDQTGIVSPIETINLAPGEQLCNALSKTINQHAPDAVIIGLPLNMDGSVGDAAKSVRMFGETLAAQIEQPVHYQDERLTSYAADQKMAQSGRTHKQKKALRDALAAAEILRDFLDQHQKQ